MSVIQAALSPPVSVHASSQMCSGFDGAIDRISAQPAAKICSNVSHVLPLTVPQL
jgi:hypothetical protein